ncbi:MAG: AbrB/MazE/SpoVT family DNA-binding domain-containing protein [Dehalococcoidia bacterium]
MKTTIDNAGRVVIPKKIREAAGIEPGMELDVRLCEGRVEIEPAAVPVKLVRRPGGMLVAVPEVPIDPLPHEVVEQMLDELRGRRGRIEEL